MRLLTAAVLVLLGALPIGAQERDYGPLVLEVPASTRALAMGGAFAIGNSDADAIFHNPAMSAVAGLTLNLQRWEQASLLTLSGGTEWWGGRIGIGVQALAYSVPGSTLADDYDAGVLPVGGGEPVTEHVATVSYARRIKGVRLGVAGKLIDQSAAGDRATGGAFDLSTGVQVARLNLGLTLQNLGPSVDLVGSSVTPPLRATLGGAFAQPMPVGPLDLFVAGAVTYEADGTFVPGLGVELGYWPIAGRTFFARAGLRDPSADALQPWTVGAGFSGDRITIDYALDPHDGVRDAHRVTLRWR
jgi:hypothetical protein